VEAGEMVPEPDEAGEQDIGLLTVEDLRGGGGGFLPMGELAARWGGTGLHGLPIVLPLGWPSKQSTGLEGAF